MEGHTSLHFGTSNNGEAEGVASVHTDNVTQSGSNGISAERRRRLAEILNGIELLLEFACRNALQASELNEEALNDLILRVAQARYQFDVGEFNSDCEAQLLRDLRRLSIAFHPVSVGSIRDSTDGLGSRCKKFVFWGAPISQAAAVVRRFTCCFFAALVLLLAVQIIWLVGYDLDARFRASSKNQPSSESVLSAAKNVDDGNLETQHRALLGLLQRWWDLVGLPRMSVVESSSGSVRRVDASDKYEPAVDLDAQLLPKENEGADDTHESALELEVQRPQKENVNVDDAHEPALELEVQWPQKENVYAANAYEPTAGLDPERLQEKSNQILVMVQTELNILQTYVLPLLYGFLGTCTYILRQLTLEIRARTFRGEAEIAYWLRIFLGLLAGLAIGWFLRPEKDGDGLVRGLTPFALSFLAGYSVEVLFSGMDRFVAAFGPGTERQSSASTQIPDRRS